MPKRPTEKEIDAAYGLEPVYEPGTAPGTGSPGGSESIRCSVRIAVSPSRR